MAITGMRQADQRGGPGAIPAREQSVYQSQSRAPCQYDLSGSTLLSAVPKILSLSLFSACHG